MVTQQLLIMVIIFVILRGFKTRMIPIKNHRGVDGVIPIERTGVVLLTPDGGVLRGSRMCPAPGAVHASVVVPNDSVDAAGRRFLDKEQRDGGRNPPDPGGRGMG
jgi:hypothetical protein